MDSDWLTTRVIATNILDRVLVYKQFLDEALESSVAFNNLELRDRAFVRKIVSTVLRRLGQIDSLIFCCLKKPISGSNRIVLTILRVGVVQLIFLKTADHAAISTSVDLAVYFKKPTFKNLINAVLRRLQRESESILTRQDIEKINTPNWLWNSWVDAYGEDLTRKIALAHLNEPPLDISHKTCQIESEPLLGGFLLPWGTERCRVSGDIKSLPGFAKGLWWVQDAAARFAVSLIGNVQGKFVIDLCAAPGGKTFYMLSMGAEVLSVDRSKERLAKMNRNLARLNLKGATI